MNRFYTLFTFLMLFSLSAYGQIEQISIGASYSQQAFYNLETGESHNLDNDSWEIAFSNLSNFDIGIFINESTSYTGSPVQLFLSNTESWDEKITIEQNFSADTPIFNPEEDWESGAFNSVNVEGDPFDYGWGVYNPQSHVVEGSRIFVIKMRDESYIKMEVVNYTGGVYNVRYAGLDGANERTIAIDKNTSDDPLILVSLRDEVIVDVPIDYDLIFQRYNTLLDAGDGTFIDYEVAGVLLSPGTEAVLLEDVAADDVKVSDYLDSFLSLPTLIGHEWKYFDFTTGWAIEESRSQLVKTADNNVYHIQFLDFEGSSTGIATLSKNYIESIVSSVDDREMLDVNVYPNPTSDYIAIDLESHDNVEIEIYSLSGKRMLRQSTLTKEVVKVGHLPSGQYTLRLLVDGYTHTQKLVIIQ